MVDDTEEIRQRAKDFAKANRKEIVRLATAGFAPVERPLSMFMAGSPGAGKTEVSKQALTLVGGGNIMRIDADELRDCFRECGYTGDNSHLFQSAATALVHAVHSAALKQKLSFLLDGTFANADMARQNIERSLKRGREVTIIFVYQSPPVAWNFVLKREKVEGRRIRAEDFAAKFCASQQVVALMKAEFGEQITLSLVQKDIDAGTKSYHRGIARLDDHIAETYTEAEILRTISA